MTFFYYLIVGFIVGLLARAIMPGRQHMGIILTTVLGIVGSFIGGLIGNLFGGTHDLWSIRASGWILSIIGAVLLLAIAQAVQGRHHHAAV